MRIGDPQPTPPSLDTNSNFEFFKSEIKSVIAELNERSETDLMPTKSGQVFIDENGIKLSAPTARLGRQAIVYFLTIEQNNKKFDCTLRNKPEDAETYKHTIKIKPVAKKYLPELYGVENGWVIMEKLNGMELKEIEEKIKTDEIFRKNYAKNCAEALYILTTNGIYINDVNFAYGHNIKAKANGTFKFIEQKTSLEPEFLPSLQLTPNEMVTERIFRHLRNIPKWNSRNKQYYDFEFQFFYNLIHKINPEDLLIKYRQPWEQNPKDIVIFGQYLNPEFIKSLKDHNIEKFIELITTKKVIFPLEKIDKNTVLIK